MELHSFRTSVWIVLATLQLWTILIAPVISQEGFVSINCGGPGGQDPVTGLEWVTDFGFLDSASQLEKEGVVVSATVNYDADNINASTHDNWEQLKTAQIFLPGRSARSKYCYNFPVSHFENNSTDYLVRAIFPNSNLIPNVGGVDLDLYGTRFYFTVDSTFVTKIELDESKPQTVELVVSSLDHNLYICLVPLEDRSSMPAISSLELRPLRNVYDQRSTAGSTNSGSTLRTATTYLMTVSRQNFGGDESVPSLRYPADQYDRLWYPAHISEERSSQTKKEQSSPFVDLNLTNFDLPLEVYNTAWEGMDLFSEIVVTVDIKAAREVRSVPTFYLRWFFFEVEETNSSRYLDVVVEHLGPENELKDNITWAEGVEFKRKKVWWWYNFKQVLLGDTALFRFTQNGSSELPPMVNAFEIYGEFEAMERTEGEEVLLIEGFAESFEKSELPIDTAGDPCLPYPWAWLVCSIEVPPQITQINLTSKGVSGKLSAFEKFGLFDRLTVLDLSNNSFYGSLPPTLTQVVTLRALNVANNDLTGELPDFEEKSLKNLESVSLGNNKLSGTLSALVKALDDTATTLNVSQNQFTGSIPTEMKELRNLRILDLSHNSLSGTLDKELVELPELHNLNLEMNEFKGVIPDEIWSSETKLVNIYLMSNNFTEVNLTTWSQIVLAEKRFDAGQLQQQVNLVGNNIHNVILPSEDLGLFELFSEPLTTNSNPGFILLGGNPWCNTVEENANKTLLQRYLCRDSEQVDFWPTSSGKNSGVSTSTVVAIVVTCGILVLLVACISALILRRSWERMKNLRQIQEALFKEDVRPPFFKYEELKAATGDFSQQNELGRGAFGAVYKAVLGDGSVVAVKRLFPTDQNLNEFFKEMVLITGIKHRHLVQLKGCCVRDKQRMLVYEYAENKNLAQALWGKERPFALNWTQRLKICVGIARGLSYLHEELQPKIIHRDIKPQNILLDKDLNAKIADFGLARPMNEDVTQMATSLGGTLGYFSPEYATLGILTEKLDVYSYGVLVLEIISGRPSINFSSPENEVYLQKWAVKMYKEDKLVNIAAEGLLAQSRGDEITTVLKTALSCLHEDPEKRPSMSQVVNMLTGNSEVAIDILKELRSRDQQLLFDDLLNVPKINDKPEREDRALLYSTSSSSNAHPNIELSIMKPR